MHDRSQQKVGEHERDQQSLSAAATSAAPGRHSRRKKRVLFLYLLVAVTVGLFFWLTFSPWGLDQALEFGAKRAPGTLEITGVSGGLLRTIAIEQLAWTGRPDNPIVVTARGIRARLAWQDLLSGQRTLSSLSVDDLVLELPSASETAGTRERPTIVPLSVQQGSIGTLRIKRSDGQRTELSQLSSRDLGVTEGGSLIWSEFSAERGPYRFSTAGQAELFYPNNLALEGWVEVELPDSRGGKPLQLRIQGSASGTPERITIDTQTHRAGQNQLGRVAVIATIEKLRTAPLLSFEASLAEMRWPKEGPLVLLARDLRASGNGTLNEVRFRAQGDLSGPKLIDGSYLLVGTMTPGRIDIEQATGQLFGGTLETSGVIELDDTIDWEFEEAKKPLRR